MTRVTSVRNQHRVRCVMRTCLTWSVVCVGQVQIDGEILLLAALEPPPSKAEYILHNNNNHLFDIRSHITFGRRRNIRILNGTHSDRISDEVDILMRK